METQLLEGLHRESPRKRTAFGSEAENQSEGSRKRPRRHSRHEADDSLALDRSDSDPDLDGMFLDPSVDPKTLCPWCDERLPSNPTPHLVSLMASARRRSYPDDRPSNPSGLRAPPAVFVNVCQRHRFERVWIPRARRRGWPTSIEWSKLRGRVERLKEQLKAIVDDVDEDFAPMAATNETAKKGERPRKDNEFWQDIVRNVREQGSRQTTGLRGQFLHFNKTQPGYYGELGYMIIHQTLCDLFPPASFDPAAALPLTPSDFIAHVLVPEAALNLIMADLGLPRADALKTLRESVEYGVAMFPADEGEGGKSAEDGDGNRSVLTAGERIIMERARARRKVLEEEERREEEEERRAQERARQSDTEPEPGVVRRTAHMNVDSDAWLPPPSSSQSKKPKPRVIMKRKPSNGPDQHAEPRMTRSRSRSVQPESDGGVIELSSDGGGESTDASRPGAGRRRRKPREEPRQDKGKAHDETSTADVATPKPKPKPKPKPRVIGGKSFKAFASLSDLHDARDDDGDGGVKTDVASSDPPLPDEEPWRLPSSSQTVPFLSGDHKEATHVRRGRTDSALDATPRATAKHGKTADASSLVASGSKPDAAGTAHRFPLQMARERRQERGGDV
ncbi:RTC4-like domain-containing protein [Trametes polyzona]|nr:RTC4-like domain-containing protein [Trametes polyzona]